MDAQQVWEHSVLLALVKEWHHHNAVLFGRVLKPPMFALLQGHKPLGSYEPGARHLSISRDLVREHPWVAVVEVLKHEMAHQYVFELLGVKDQVPHGEAFQAVCRRHRIDPAASGVPVEGTPGALGAEEERVLRRVEKLLALAQSPHAHEAQSAMQAARDLLVKHNLDHVPAANGERFVVRHLGTPLARLGAHHRVLGGILVNHFFVMGIWLQTFDQRKGAYGQVLEVMGSHANVEVATYVHAFLLHTSQRLQELDMEEHGTSGRYRLRFMAAVMRGFSQKLTQSKHVEQQQALIRVKDAGLNAFHEARHPTSRKARFRMTGGTDVDARGEAAGRNIVLQKGVTGSTAHRGRLLGQ